MRNIAVAFQFVDEEESVRTGIGIVMGIPYSQPVLGIFTIIPKQPPGNPSRPNLRCQIFSSGVEQKCWYVACYLVAIVDVLKNSTK